VLVNLLEKLQHHCAGAAVVPTHNLDEICLDFLVLLHVFCCRGQLLDAFALVHNTSSGGQILVSWTAA